MFRRIKNTLISQRKVVKASGRDTGDAMKLSRDKVSDISHKIIEMLRKSRELRLRNKDSNAVRLEIVRQMTDVLMTEDKVDRAARAKIRTQKRDIPEGSEEWDTPLRRTTPKSCASSGSISPPASRFSPLPFCGRREHN
jgi:hypothetical protein